MPTLRLTLFLVSAGALLLAACAGEAVVQERITTITESVESIVETVGETVVVTEIVEVPGELVVEPGVEPMAQELLAALDWGELDSIADAPLSIRQPARLIIKSASIAIIVEETDRAVDRAVQVAVDYGGYIISQRVWDGANHYRYASITIAVPVDQFEMAMRSLRALGVVTSETASGQDVSDEFVDLNSRLENLQATQQRLRTFLEQATTITETLSVHEELRKVEDQIGLIQGRMNYLRDRAAYSTITLELNPFIPAPTPTLTPTVTPTSAPAPTATPAVWRPGETAGTAAKQLQRTSQVTADWLIYNGIVCGPWLVFFLGLGWITYRAWRKLERQIDYRAG